MQALAQISINFQALNGSPKYTFPIYEYSKYKFKFTQPISYYSHPTTKIEPFRANGPKAAVVRGRLSFSGVNRDKYGISVNRRKRVVLVKFNKGLNELGRGGGGGSGRVNGETARVLGNLAVAILLTYLSMTGQLGWLLDAIVSIWLILVLVPIVGIGAFLWWAGRDIVQSSCPNCGNEFQVFKSTLNDELQLCPFCTQPFSVVGNEFVSEPVKFSNQSTTFDQGFSDFSARKKKGSDSSMAVVDVEAEIRDAE